ncbi:hypothetical protein FRC16_006600 [Serendipita sp. 398]|nr:hypothetical protein FRC16_006600 [Serendipita sp. 398]
MFRLLHFTRYHRASLRRSDLLYLLDHTRYASSTIVRAPPSSAPREAPVPLVFPTIRGWYDQESKHGINTYAAMLRELGFTTIEVELELEKGSKEKKLDDLVRDYAKELRSEIALASIFPPVLISRGVSTLAVHAYVESYPVSGIGLIGPVSLVPRILTLPGASQLGTRATIPEFNYEANFPICLIESDEVQILGLSSDARDSPTLISAIASMSTKFDPNNAQNLVEIEKQFAVKAVEHAQTYWNLLEAVPPSSLKLTRLDDEIHEHFSQDFPELIENPQKIKMLDEEWMKDPTGKERWRKFISAYEKRVDDYNFGSLIRTNSSGEYSETNSIFVTRMQFYAIEIARNRLGFNDDIYAEAQKEKAKAKKAQQS